MSEIKSNLKSLGKTAALGGVVAASVTGFNHATGDTRHDGVNEGREEPSPVERVQHLSEIEGQDIPGGTLVYDDKEDRYLVYVQPQSGYESVDNPMDPGWHEIDRETVVQVNADK